MFKEYRHDPIKDALVTPSGNTEIFSKTISDFGYHDCPVHIVLREPY